MLRYMMRQGNDVYAMHETKPFDWQIACYPNSYDRLQKEFNTFFSHPELQKAMNMKDMENAGNGVFSLAIKHGAKMQFFSQNDLASRFIRHHYLNCYDWPYSNLLKKARGRPQKGFTDKSLMDTERILGMIENDPASIGINAKGYQVFFEVPLRSAWSMRFTKRREMLEYILTGEHEKNGKGELACVDAILSTRDAEYLIEIKTTSNGEMKSKDERKEMKQLLIASHMMEANNLKRRFLAVRVNYVDDGVVKGLESKIYKLDRMTRSLTAKGLPYYSYLD